MLSAPGVTSSAHDFQMFKNYANAENPLLVQLAAGMTLPSVGCLALLPDLTMETPLGLVSRFMNLMTLNRHTVTIYLSVKGTLLQR